MEALLLGFQLHHVAGAHAGAGGSTAMNAFSPPANVQDFPTDPQKQAALVARWTQFLEGFIQLAIVGDPWTNVNDENRILYFNPLATPISPNAVVATIPWIAFPNRLSAFFAASQGSPYALSDEEVYELADQGYLKEKPDFAAGFPIVPSDVYPTIDWQQLKNDWEDYGPPGPRGWQDEYCEWCVERNAAGDIIGIDFTCENPEYWVALWKTDASAVCSIYQSVVNASVQFDDLVMRDNTGDPVIDPETGLPAYNPLNKWNTGTVATATGGGAIHLTSPPNDIDGEIYLAAAATLLRNVTPYTAAALTNCAQYGVPYRNSDPNIGYNVNQVVKNAGGSGLRMVTLTDPIGLYMQQPDFSSYATPDGTDARTFWTVVRGSAPDKILHARYAVPASKGYTVSDITIGKQKIQYAGQIAQTFQMGLSATVQAASQIEATLPCVDSKPAQQCSPWPQVIMGAAMLEAYSSIMGYLGTSGLPPPTLKQGATASFALQVLNATANATISVVGGGVTITVTGVKVSESTATFTVDITVDANAAPGVRAVQVEDPAYPAGPPAPGMLIVAPA
jgi:hypothetical protein